MAEEVKAIRAYTPRVVQGDMVEIEDVADYIEGRTSLNGGAVLNMLWEFRKALTVFALSGRPVRLKGLGIFSPRMDKDGVVGLNFRMDPWLKSELNVKGKFKGEMVNRDMLGKSAAEMIERWNDEHPDDKIKVKDKK